jgi:3-oxoadipate enol-lactonase
MEPTDDREQPVAPRPAPDLPSGRLLDLPDRGTTFVREVDGPPGAPTVLLLHGWTVTADLNFYATYAPLGRRFRVVAADHRGHGRGLRADTPFTLEDAADDAAAVVRELGLGPVVAVGYSMGGAVAQLLWHRHPELVDGLVLCATAGVFNESREEALRFLGLNGLAGLVRAAPDTAKKWVADQYLTRKGRSYEDWAIEELSRHDLAAQVEAGAAIGRFSSIEWLSEVDVPTSVVVTTDDQVVPMRRQIQLFESIPTAQAYRVDGPHDAIASRSEHFVPTLVAAATSVAERARRRRDGGPDSDIVLGAGDAATVGVHRTARPADRPAERATTRASRPRFSGLTLKARAGGPIDKQQPTARVSREEPAPRSSE